LTTGAPAAEAGGREPRGFVERGGWQVVAFLAALALVLTMSIDWYTTQQGEEFRRVEKSAQHTNQATDPNLDKQAAQAAEAQEKTAWQADAFVDRLITIACLIAFLGAVAAAFMRSAGREPQPPWHPSAIATVAGVLGTILLVYRMIQPPGFNDVAVIKPGAPLGLVALGVLTIASRLAVLTEREERAGLTADGASADAAGAADPGERAAPSGPGRAARLRGEASDWRRRRRESRAAAAAAAAAAAEATPEPAPATPATADTSFEFDFPQPPPPEPAHREELPPPGPEPAVEPEASAPAPPPVEEPPPPVEEPPPPVEEPPPPVEEPPPPVEEPPPPVEEATPEPVAAEPDHDDADTDESPAVELPDEPSVGEPPIVDPVEEPPVEEPPVEPVVESPLAPGEEIEFEFEQPPGAEPPPPDPGSRVEDPDGPPPG
jgi:hypothetical protein